MVLLFKDTWKRWQTNAVGFAVFFAIIFAVIRGAGMLGPQSMRPLIPMGFVMMTILPFIFLRSEGRRQIGLIKTKISWTYITALLYGTGAASLCFVLGVLLFDKSPDNWFITIRNYYTAQIPGALDMPQQRFFIIATVPALIFSPIGEEIFFRGFLQDALETRFGLRSSMIIESAIFGIVHLFHHGLVRSNDSVNFFPFSGMLWVILMFLTAYGFASLRKRSGSIYPSIAAHAMFNLMMNIYIFSFLIDK
jgi:membrane protease YdiL (CAAX protease family)